jgi:hypothetical protein
MVLSVFAIWTRNQIADTDRYVRTVAPLASEPAIQTALVDRVTTELSAFLDENVAREGLTDRGSFLAAPLADLLVQFVHDTAQEFVTSPEFPVLWEEINRAAHPVVSAVLMGEGTESVSTDQGQITLDIAPLITEVLNRLSARGLNIVDRIPVDRLNTTFVIYESQDLADIQSIVSLIEELAYWLPIVALVSLVGAVIFSVSRRRTIIHAGLGLAATMAILVILLAFARSWTIDHLSPDVNTDAATVFFETIGRYLRAAIRILILVGLVVAALAFLIRPGDWVSQERKEAIRQPVRNAWHAVEARFSGVGSWVNAHYVALLIGIGVVCCLLATIWDPLSTGRAAAILLILVVGCAALWLFHRRMGAFAVAAPGVGPALATVEGTGVSYVSATSPRVVPASPRSASPVDDARADLAALAGTLSDDDVRMLRRVAAALRDST